MHIVDLLFISGGHFDLLVLKPVSKESGDGRIKKYIVACQAHSVYEGPDGGVPIPVPS